MGRKKPRLYTKPLRKLTPETSLGFEVIEFATLILRVTLYPWQQWLLKHALELNPDGSYRFRRVIVLVGRQNGKSMLASVLAAWWLFVDSQRHPDRMPPVKFRVLGTAQNLDTARDVWQQVRLWCDPNADPDEDASVLPALQEFTDKVLDVNGKEQIVLKSKTQYLIRAASRKSGRGKSAPRVLMDEMREQLDWSAWDSVSQTTKAMFSPQLWGFSNAGDARSVVLNHQRKAALSFIEAWDDYVDRGISSIEDFANGRDTSLGLFEWSAPDGCELDDVDAILQSNPSIGHGEITVESVLADIDGLTEAGYRTEVLCQWVTAMVETHLDGSAWADAADPSSEPIAGTRIVLGVDTSADRSMTYLAIVGLRDDGDMHGEVIAQRAGMLWVVDAVKRAAELNGITEIALQARGCPASEFIDPLEKAGLTVHRVEGSALGASAGQTRDRVRNGTLRHRGDQDVLNLAVSGAVARKLNEVRVWDRINSVVDISPLVALSCAQWAHDNTEPPEPFVSAYEDDGLLVV